jgi:hypothetical protein
VTAEEIIAAAEKIPVTLVEAAPPFTAPVSVQPPVDVSRVLTPRRRTFIPYAPTSYEEHMRRLDRLRDATDDDDLAKYGTGEIA